MWKFIKNNRVSYVEGSLRWVALFALVVQTVAGVLTLRLSRLTSSDTGTAYLTTTAVFCSEILKFVAAIPLVWWEQGKDFKRTMVVVCNEVFFNPLEMAKIGVPALLYTLQNNLIYIALSCLSGAMYQVTYQLKILTTALLSTVLLGRRLSFLRWFSLFMLFLGVVLIQFSSADVTHRTPEGEGDRILGLFAVFSACITSGLAGVYLEKLIKENKTTLWIRNMQLAMYGVLLGGLGAFWKDGDTIARVGFFQGYTTLTVVTIVMQALGGLVVAAVLKYADNILKCFGNAISIIFSCIVSWTFVGDFKPSCCFSLGTLLVLTASYLYIVDNPAERRMRVCKGCHEHGKYNRIKCAQCS